MKKWIPIIAILIVVAFASGCTSQSQTYNANGITFQYPGDWNPINSTSIQQGLGNTATILVSVGKEGAGVTVTKVTDPAITVNDLTEVFKSLATTGGNQMVSQTTRTIDGVTANLITDKNTNGTYYTNVVFQKNNNLYLITITSPSSDQANVDMILNSFKVQ